MGVHGGQAKVGASGHQIPGLRTIRPTTATSMATNAMEPVVVVMAGVGGHGGLGRGEVG
jgi:hypothetical protein